MGDNDDEFQPGIDNGYEKNRGFPSPSVNPKYWCQTWYILSNADIFPDKPIKMFSY